MAEIDLRDPAADRRRARRHVAAVLAVAAVAVVAASFVALTNRPADHAYRYYLSYGNANGVPYTLLVPLPADGELRASWRFLGNGTAAIEESPYGPVLRIASWSNVTVSCALDTWRDASAAFTTEGPSAGGRPAARVFLNSTEFAVSSSLRITLTETDPTWTLTRTLEGDLFEGWNTFEVRESLARTSAR